MPLIPVPQYLSVDDADDYFNTRLNSDVWQQSSPEDRLAALVTATRAIDQLNFVGTKATPTQLTEFPRAAASIVGRDGVVTPGPVPAVPAAILMACCEEAVQRLDGDDIELEIDGLGVATTTYAGVRETYDRTTVSEATRAGITSQVAWNFLVPWLADAQAINLCRV